MSLCPICKKEFKNLKIHFAQQSKKDEEHKKHIETQNFSQQPSFKILEPGQTISSSKEKFVVVQDAGSKVVVQPDGKNFLKMKISKSEFNECSM